MISSRDNTFQVPSFSTTCVTGQPPPLHVLGIEVEEFIHEANHGSILHFPLQDCPLIAAEQRESQSE